MEKKTEALTDYEREHLRQLVAHPGFAVLEQIQEAYLDAIKQGSLAISLGDPLGKKDELANVWAYYRMGLSFKAMVKAGVEREIAALNGHGTKRTAEEERLRAQAWFGTGQIGPIPDNFVAPKH